MLAIKINNKIKDRLTGTFAKYREMLMQLLCKHLHTEITRPVSLMGNVPSYYCMKCGRKHEVNW